MHQHDGAIPWVAFDLEICLKRSLEKTNFKRPTAPPDEPAVSLGQTNQQKMRNSHDKGSNACQRCGDVEASHSLDNQWHETHKRCYRQYLHDDANEDHELLPVFGHTDGISPKGAVDVAFLSCTGQPKLDPPDGAWLRSSGVSNLALERLLGSKEKLKIPRTTAIPPSTRNMTCRPCSTPDLSP